MSATGDISNRKLRRSLGAHVLVGEYLQFVEAADAQGIAPSALCARLIRNEIARHSGEREAEHA